MSETLMALMKKGGGSDIEYIDEDIEFEFPTTNGAKKDLYVYSQQGKAPKCLFLETIGATNPSGCNWTNDIPTLDILWRSTDGGATYSGFFRDVGGTTVNGFNVNEIGADYVKFVYQHGTGYAGTGAHIKIFFE